MTEPVGALALMAVGCVAGVVALVLVVRARLGVRWATFGWGALAFVVSQAVRLPLLSALGLAGNVVALLLTSGLAEETARWVVLRHGDRRARGWRDGVAFGVGHGGIEAVLLVAVTAVGGIVLLSSADEVLAQVQGTAAAGAVTQQLEALRAMTLGTALIALWERVAAVMLHVSLSLLVLRTVVTRRPQWYAAAVVLHIAVNAMAVTLLPRTGPVAVELALTAVAATLLWLTLRMRHTWPIPEPEPAAVAAVPGQDFP